VKIPPNIRWPAVIVGALVIHVVVSLTMVWVASSNPSYAVEEDYYQKALHWDEKRAQDRHNAELGWLLGFTVEPGVAGGSAVLEVTATDALGRPLGGATVSVETFHNARAGDILRARLDTVGEGVYRTILPMRHNGRWELRFTVDRDDDHFTHTETRHLIVEVTWE